MPDQTIGGIEQNQSAELSHTLASLDAKQQEMETRWREYRHRSEVQLEPITTGLKQVYQQLINPGDPKLVSEGARVHRKLTDNGDGTYGLFFQEEDQFPSQTTVRMCLLDQATDYLGYFGYGLMESPYVIVHYDSTGEPIDFIAFDTAKMKQDKANGGNPNQSEYALRHQVIPDWDPSGKKTDEVLKILSPIVESFSKPIISPKEVVQEAARLPSFTY